MVAKVYGEQGPPQTLSAPAERGGEGGGLYSECVQSRTYTFPEKEEKESSSSSSQKAETQLASTLRDLGVFLLAPPKRSSVAAALADAGVTAQDVLDIAAFVAESEPDGAKQRRYLASVLVKPKATRQALDDLHAFRARHVDALLPMVPGEVLRRHGIEQVRRFEAEFAAARQRGEVNPKSREPHVWERGFA